MLKDLLDKIKAAISALLAKIKAMIASLNPGYAS